MNFVKTNDANTATILRNAGFTELGKEGAFFVFINEPGKMNFSENDKKKMIYTNVVCL